MSKVPWSLVSVSNIDHDGAISDLRMDIKACKDQARLCFSTKSGLTKRYLKQDRSSKLRVSEIHRSSRRKRTSIMNYVNTREIDTAKWVTWRGVSGLRAHKV